MSFFSRIFCSHDFNKVDSFHIESEIEQLKRLGATPKTSNSSISYEVRLFKCNKCGYLKEFKYKSKG